MEEKDIENVKRYLKMRKIDKNDTLAQFVAELNEEVRKKEENGENTTEGID